MPTDTSIVNHALLLLGEKRIGNFVRQPDGTYFYDDVKAGREASAVYEQVRDALLANYNWQFAMKRAVVAVSQTPPEFGFDTAYDFPSDCLRPVMLNEIFAGMDLSDYRSGPNELFDVENNRILMNTGATTVGDSSLDSQIDVEVDYPGLGFQSLPNWGVSGGGGTGATLVTASMKVVGVKPAAAGALYIPGIMVQPNGGVFTRKATLICIDNGGVADWDVLDGGAYTTLPGVNATVNTVKCTGPVATTTLSGGAGLGATVYLAWGVGEVTVTNGGQNYATVPDVVTTSGAPNSTASGLATLLPNTTVTGPDLNLRYVTRVTDSSKFADPFAMLLAADLAVNLAEVLTQSDAKFNRAVAVRKKALSEAIRSNAIMLPPRKLGDDELLFSRL